MSKPKWLQQFLPGLEPEPSEMPRRYSSTDLTIAVYPLTYWGDWMVTLNPDYIDALFEEHHFKSNFFISYKDCK